MKIAIVISNLSGGGAEFVAREWAGELERTGHEVVVLVTHPKPTDRTFFAGKIIPVPGVTAIQHVLAARKIVREQRPDVVLGLLPYFNILAVLSVLRQKHRPVVAISGRNVEVPYPLVHGRRYLVTRWLSKLLFPHADRFVAISHAVAAEAMALYRLSPSKVRVVPNPATAKVGTPDVKYPPVDPSRQINLIVPGRLVGQKRPETAVSSAVELRRRGYDVSLSFFGVGPLQAEVEALAKAADLPTQFRGWDERWFLNSPENSVVLLTSLAEGFGNVFVEAAAVGIPSVASSACLGAADAIVPGITGALVGGTDASDFADGVELAMRVGDIDADRWLARFSVSASTRELVETLS